ncbi:TPA: DUF6270 domain-containing protein [Mannheimia haemolytica]
MNNLFILGSCVSRDAFTLDEGRSYNIISYLARTSFASAFHGLSVQDIDLSQIPSAFQKRMVENDLFKQADRALKHNEFDWLIIDLIDERFSIFVSDKEEIFTLSPEFSNNCIFDKPGKVLVPNSDEFFEWWKKGWDNFIKLAKKHQFLHKIILNKVFWTNQTYSGGQVVPDLYQSWIDENNLWLKALYSYIEKTGGIKILEYPKELLKADPDHKWGLQPYHYAKPLYLYFLDSIAHLNTYQKALESNIVHTDYLPLILDTLPIKRKNDSGYQPLIFQGGEQDCIVNINITFAANKMGGERDLLHTLRYEPEQSELYSEQKYACSDFEEIGHFKYIGTQSYTVYNREIKFRIPANTRAFFSIQEFYPEGKNIILEAEINKVDK